jgi:hypothetical protein
LCTRPNGLPDCVVQAGVSRAGFVVKENFFNTPDIPLAKANGN